MSTTDVVEQIVSGTAPDDHELAALATELRTRYEFEAQDEVAARMGVDLARVAREASSASPGAPARRRGRLRRRLAPVLVSSVLLAGMTGVAMAADSAVPGDFLYPLDRALEVVGIGAGGAEERILEARVMFDDGRITEAVAHAAEAVAGSDDPVLVQAVEDMRKAAERTLATGSDDAGTTTANPPHPIAEDRGRPAANQPSPNADERATLGPDNASEKTGPQPGASKQPEEPGPANKPEEPGPANKPEEPGSQAAGGPDRSGTPRQAPESPGEVGKPEEPGSGGGPPENPGKSGERDDRTPGEPPENKGGGGPPDEKPRGKP